MHSMPAIARPSPAMPAVAWRWSRVALAVAPRRAGAARGSRVVIRPLALIVAKACRRAARRRSGTRRAGREGRLPAERGGETAQGHRGEGDWVPMALDRILAEAEQTMGPIAGLAIRNPGRSNAVVEARPVLGNVIELTKGRSMQ